MSHSTDNVAACRYTVPDYWTIGEVYERLIEDVTGEDEDDEHLIDHLMEVYTSWIDDAISNYNSDFYYQSRDYLFACYQLAMHVIRQHPLAQTNTIRV